MGKPKIRTWDKMKAKLKAKFLPPHYLQDNYLKLHYLKQGNKSVEEYTREFEQLLLKCDLKEDETQTLIRYLSGLDEQIAHTIELHPYSSLDELSSLAYKVEQQKKSKGKAPISKPPPCSYPLQGTTNTLPSPQINPFPRPTPPTVQNTPQKNPPKPDMRIRCYRCQGLGHIASECPNQKIVTLAEYQASCEEIEEEEGGGGKELLLNEPMEEVEEGPDEGELLVIRRALSGLVPQNELDQRESIFHTRCTIEGKVCSLIIDGGSCTNVASKTMVEKLKLVTTPHPNPYTIQWLHQGKGLRVSFHCLVSFSIGKNYNDEIWCDILPMDACHVLLGRPWLFDRRVMLDGYSNTYTFTKDHKKITLTPLKSNPLKKPQHPPNKDVLFTTCLHPPPHEFEVHKVHEPVEAKGSSHPLLVGPTKFFSTNAREKSGNAREQAKPRTKKPRKRAHPQPEDLVWVELRKETFPNKRKPKFLKTFRV